MPCYRPIKMVHDDELIEVPCARCVGCLERRRRDWAVRMTHEAELHAENCFITLTYDQEHVPEDASLDITHWQRFAKRLRKRRGPFRFYHCGEYGPETLRPHLHACLFSMDFPDKLLVDDSKSGQPMYESATLNEVWGMGRTTVQSFTPETAAYTAGYVMKKNWQSNATERLDPMTGECWNVKPEYATMSRRPGIGADWLKKFHSDVYPHGYVTTPDGTKLPPPKYYDNQLDQADLDRLKSERKAKALERREDETPDRRETRERVAHAKYDFYHQTRMS